MTTEYYLYLISEGEDGPIKIGTAGNPWARIMELQTGNPRRLSVVKAWSYSSKDAVFKRERFLHEMLQLFQLVGEWFDLSEAEAIAVIEGRCNKIEASQDDLGEIVDDGGWLDERKA